MTWAFSKLKNIFNISKQKKAINTSYGDIVGIYSVPVSAAEFNTAYDNLYRHLSSIGKINRSTSSAQSSTQSNGKSTSAERPAGPLIGLPTSGVLSPITFVKHPFGFMPQELLTQSEACSYLSAAGWPAEPYEKLIYIVSCTAFQIPYTVYGKPVSVMTMYNGGTSYYTYSFKVSDFKSNWSEAHASQFAERIYDELKKAGFRDTKVKYPYSGNFYQKALTDGKFYIRIDALSTSKYEKHDAYGVEFEVQLM